MKTTYFLSLLFLSLNACIINSSAESVEYLSDSRKTDAFYGLIVNVPANVILSQGQGHEVRVEGDRALLNSVSTQIENGALVINGSNNRPVTIYITLEDLNRVEVNGSARVFAQTLINSDFMVLKVNGSGTIRMDVRTLKLGMIIRGNGKIYASGSSDEVTGKVIGNGNIYAKNLDSFYSEENIVRSAARSSSEEADKNSRRQMLNIHQ